MSPLCGPALKKSTCSSEHGESLCSAPVITVAVPVVATRRLLLKERLLLYNSAVHSAPAWGRDSHCRSLSVPSFRGVLVRFEVVGYSIGKDYEGEGAYCQVFCAFPRLKLRLLNAEFQRATQFSYKP